MEEKPNATSKLAVASSSGVKKGEATSNGQKRHSMGRQKIAIKRILKDESRQVCFSKRRAGLFKKALELSVRCGAELAVLVFSPGGKPFSFGHPSVHYVIDRYLSSETSLNPNLHLQAHRHMSSSHDATSELNQELVDLTARLEASRKRKEMLKSALSSRKGSIWSADVEELGLNELEMVKNGLEKLWFDLENKKERQMLEAGIIANGYGYKDGFGYGFDNCGYGLFDQKVNPMMPDPFYADHGLFFLPQ